jgi:hypothetical protein
MAGEGRWVHGVVLRAASFLAGRLLAYRGAGRPGCPDVATSFVLTAGAAGSPPFWWESPVCLTALG